ncbi:MAG: thymidylate kinase [Ruminococcaceae bacterium]|nr:thymidylate kinase [Oscillospiraceae bacterium]
MGRFLVIDGLDGSGKETQTKLLTEYLTGIGKRVRVLSFPCYESKSSLFVRMYLDGELGSRPDDTNAYAASSFFAADRYLSYRLDWKKDMDDPDTVVIANRYTTANAVHQLAKLPETEWDTFLSWLWDYEFAKLGIPKPDEILYLEMLPEISIRLIKSRSAETGRAVDIHEADESFLHRSYKAAMYASERLGWTRIRCYRGDEPKSREEIAKEIREALKL